MDRYFALNLEIFPPASTYVSRGTELLEVYLGLRRSWEVSYVASKSCVFFKKNTKLDRGNFCESVCVRANAYV